MSSDHGERVQDWLRDIIDNSDWIATYVGSLTFDQFVADRKTRDASERCLERIIEASVRLGPERIRRIAAGQPLHEVRGLGNVLRHSYDAVDPKLIWDTLTEDVPALREACINALDKGHG